MLKFIASVGVAVVLLTATGLEVAAQTSCSGWNSTCLSRCKARGASSCPYCAQQMAACKQTGCWTEAAQFGGGKHCKLGKS